MPPHLHHSKRFTTLFTPLLLHFQTQTLPSPKHLSQSVGIPKKFLRVRDHAYDNYMEVHKKVRKILKFQEIILDQPDQSICIARLDTLARRFGFKQFESGAFILKFPHIFDIYEHPVQRILWCRLTRRAILQIESEKQALISQIPDAITRLRKLLMISNDGRLRLEHIRIARADLGLPDDFEFSVILKNPEFFRLVDAKDARMKYVEIVEREPALCICAIERLRELEYRERGIDAENIRFSFIVNFPPGFKIGKYYKIAVWKWQRLPYWSPYDDVTSYDLRSYEAQKRMEKRAVAVIHEILSLTLEKKMSLERIAHFRTAMNMPKKMKEFLLQHQGIFYISTRGNMGKLHTVFLREAYRKGELVEPNDVYLARRKLVELILLSPRKANMDRELGHFRRNRDDEDHVRQYRERENLGVDDLGSSGMREDGSRFGEFGMDFRIGDDMGGNGEGEEEPDIDSSTGNGSDSEEMCGDDCSSEEIECEDDGME